MQTINRSLWLPVAVVITALTYQQFFSQAASLPRIFRLFRALGLRHVVVINDDFQVSAGF